MVVGESKSVIADPSTLTTGADEAYFEGLIEGEVRVQSCKGCGVPHWPAVFRCPECGSWEHTWNAVRPVGSIYSWTRTWHAFGGLDAFTTPFVSVVVTLDDVPSVRLLGLLEGGEEGLSIGAAVRADVHSIAYHGRMIPALRWAVV